MGQRPEARTVEDFPYEPAGPYIIIRPVETGSREFGGGITVPDESVNDANWGEVIAVGPGHRTTDGEWIPVPVELHDEVLVYRMSGVMYKEPDVGEIKLIRREDILMINKPERVERVNSA